MITPMDIHNKTFSRGIRGYNQEEVEAFLQELAGDYERIYREHREMEEEMDTIKTKLRKDGIYHVIYVGNGTGNGRKRKEKCRKRSGIIRS